MDGVSGVGSRIHLTEDDDRRTSTNIVERDTKVAIRGDDGSWREVKADQNSFGEEAPHIAAHAGHAALEALDGAEMLFGGGALAGAGVGALGAAGLILGGLELYEAHEKADAQKAALSKDNARAAMIANLDLPPGYKGMRLDSDLKHVGKETRSEAFKMTEAVRADRKGCALLQLHCDRGMNAGRDWAASGMTKEAFLKANPKIADACSKDPAFKEGFEAFVHTTKHGTEAEVKEMNRKLDERDGWYAQDHVAIRV